MSESWEQMVFNDITSYRCIIQDGHTRFGLGFEVWSFA